MENTLILPSIIESGMEYAQILHPMIKLGELFGILIIVIGCLRLGIHLAKEDDGSKLSSILAFILVGVVMTSGAWILNSQGITQERPATEYAEESLPSEDGFLINETTVVITNGDD